MQPLQQPHNYHQMESNLGDEDSCVYRATIAIQGFHENRLNIECCMRTWRYVYLSQTNKHDVKLVHASHTVECNLLIADLNRVHGVRIFRVVTGRQNFYLVECISYNQYILLTRFDTFSHLVKLDIIEVICTVGFILFYFILQIEKAQRRSGNYFVGRPWSLVSTVWIWQQKVQFALLRANSILVHDILRSWEGQFTNLVLLCIGLRLE